MPAAAVAAGVLAAEGSTDLAPVVDRAEPTTVHPRPTTVHPGPPRSHLCEKSLVKNHQTARAPPPRASLLPQTTNPTHQTTKSPYHIPNSVPPLPNFVEIFQDAVGRR